MTIQKFLNGALAAVVLLGAAAFFSKGRWPARSDIRPELAVEPRQVPTEKAPFSFTFEGVRYDVEPVADYDIRGLVVSHNDTTGFGDIYHDEKSIDSKDLCVIWGSNVAGDDFRRVNFWSTAWTCWCRFPAGVNFDMTRLSNNHLVTDKPDLRRQIDDVRIGDQIEITGHLVNYRDARHPDFWRRSSVIRTDQGNGACEVLFVTNLRVLRAETRGWFALYRLCLTLLVAIPAAMLAYALFRPHHDPA